MNWQPIETAPRDDKPVLLFGLLDGEINGMSESPAAVVGVRCCDGWHVPASDCYMVMVYPTHWMPLPPPPEAL